jgi:hypothetical protein
MSTFAHVTAPLLDYLRDAGVSPNAQLLLFWSMTYVSKKQPNPFPGDKVLQEISGFPYSTYRRLLKELHGKIRYFREDGRRFNLTALLAKVELHAACKELFGTPKYDKGSEEPVEDDAAWFDKEVAMQPQPRFPTLPSVDGLLQDGPPVTVSPETVKAAQGWLTSLASSKRKALPKISDESLARSIADTAHELCIADAARYIAEISFVIFVDHVGTYEDAERLRKDLRERIARRQVAA